jgi:hypothetical protein
VDKLQGGTQIPRERRDTYQDIGSYAEKGGHGRRKTQEKPFLALQMGYCPLKSKFFYFLLIV